MPQNPAFWALVLSSFVALGCACSEEPEADPPADPPPTEEVFEQNCEDGIDDDGDGFIDCADADCRLSSPACELAAPLDRTVATTLTEAALFLYTGADPLQRGVADGALDPRRTAIVRGSIEDSEGKPLARVRVSVLGQSGLGYTYSRSDGAFDLAVNGGGRVVLVYEKSGYLSSQRSVQPAWQRYAEVPTAALVRASTVVTRIEPGAGGAQLATAEPSEDKLGKRQPIVLFEPGTSATATLADGTEQPLSSLSLRVTEYPFEPISFEEGRVVTRFAPGTPSTSGLHYGLSFAIDEADKLGAERVSFSKPAIVYVENFLRLSVGARAPLAYYNARVGRWEHSEPGLIVSIVSESNNLAALDVDGDGIADSGEKLETYGISESELRTLASRYEPGQSLWRARIGHFSSYLMEVPVKPSQNSLAPTVLLPEVRPIDEPTLRGSVLVEPQAIAQSVGINGTPYSLHYQSNRTTAYGPGFQLDVPVVAEQVPAGLLYVLSTVHIAGRQFQQGFFPSANLKHTVVWDGRDAYGRLVQGQQMARIVVGYAYLGTVNLEAFGLSGTINTADFGELPAILWTETEVPVGVWDSAGYDLGGLSINALHAYDPAHQILHFGDGRDKHGQNVALVVKEPAKGADLGSPDGIVVAPDGSAIITDDAGGRILRIAPDQSVSVLAGPGAPGAAGELRLSSPQGLAIAGDGSVWVADFGARTILAVYESGQVETIVGRASDNPRVVADLDDLDGIAFGPNDELYLTNRNEVLRLVGTALTPFAGGGTDGDGATATQTELNTPSGLAVAPDGTVYISERYGHRVRKVTRDGSIFTVAGTGTRGYSGDGAAAVDAELNQPRGLALASDGSLYIADQENGRIRRVTPDGIIVTVAGGGSESDTTGKLATDARVVAPDGIALGRDGSLFITGRAGFYHVTAGMPDVARGDSLIPSADGRILYRFDHRGKHHETIDAMTGATLLSLAYDDAGRIASLTDKNGLVTAIARGQDGLPQNILAPFGQKTSLEYQGRIVSAVSDPLARKVSFGYSASGVLEITTDPKGATHRFGYDPQNRLISVTDPTGYKETYAQKSLPRGYSVSAATPVGRVTEYSVEMAAGNVFTQAVVHPSGLRVSSKDDIITRQSVAPDGTKLTELLQADPLFGPQSSYPKQLTLETPKGRKLTAYPQREKVLSDPDNALSIVHWMEFGLFVGTGVRVRTHCAASDTVLAARDGRGLSRAEARASRRVFRGSAFMLISPLVSEVPMPGSA